MKPVEAVALLMALEFFKDIYETSQTPIVDEDNKVVAYRAKVNLSFKYHT